MKKILLSKNLCLKYFRESIRLFLLMFLFFSSCYSMNNLFNKALKSNSGKLQYTLNNGFVSEDKNDNIFRIIEECDLDDNQEVKKVAFLLRECVKNFSKNFEKGENIINTSYNGKIIKKGETLINAVCLKGSLVLVEALIEKMFEQANAQRFKESKILDLLLTESQTGFTPIMAACKVGKGKKVGEGKDGLYILEYLIDKMEEIPGYFKFLVNQVNIFGKTALFYACKNNDFEIISFLVEDMSAIIDKKCKKAVKDKKIVNFLNRYDFLDEDLLPQNEKYNIFKIIQKCNIKDKKQVEEVALLLQKSVKKFIGTFAEGRNIINFYYEGKFLKEGETLINAVCLKGSFIFVEALIEGIFEENLEGNIRESDILDLLFAESVTGITPVIAACIVGGKEGLEILGYLHEKIASINGLAFKMAANKVNKFEDFALLYACKKGDFEIVKYLVEKMAAIIDESCKKVTNNKKIIEFLNKYNFETGSKEKEAERLFFEDLGKKINGYESINKNLFPKKLSSLLK